MDEDLSSAGQESEDRSERKIKDEETGDDKESGEESDDSGKSLDTVSHKDAMQHVHSVLADIISTDPLLCDLPTEITLEEINSQIALEHGQAMVVQVRRADDIVMPIVVKQTATVLDLKHAIKRYVTLRQARQAGPTHISWRYIWKRYALHYLDQKLLDDKKILKDYGIRNKEEVTFVKRMKEMLPAVR